MKRRPWDTDEALDLLRREAYEEWLDRREEADLPFVPYEGWLREREQETLREVSPEVADDGEDAPF